MANARRKYQGPVLLSAGFRPFFLGGALYAALALVGWLWIIVGHPPFESRFSPLDWHVHELLFGVLAAIIAGFLLTAIPNWTGRLPIRGLPLLVLIVAWLCGRIAVWTSAFLPVWLAPILDLLFLALLVAAAGREIIAGKNWRNLRVLAPVTLLLIANALFHVEAAMTGDAVYARRLGIAAILALVMLIGGRIVPSFTRNWLARQAPGRLPAPFNRFDGASIIVAIVALVGWVVFPDHPATGILMLIAGILHLGRLARWAGERTFTDRLVLVLHVAYLFVPIGFLLGGIAVFLPAVPPSAGIHAWTAGAMGTMTLAVMSRASLGHTGNELKAGASLEAIYALVVLAALLRIAASLIPEHGMTLYTAAGYSWILAYLGFALTFGPLLLRDRLR